MGETRVVTVKMFGLLHSFRKNRGEPSTADVEVPPDGLPAHAIAGLLELPLDMIEGVFLDHKIHSLDLIVKPGASIAFASRGVPGPHRFTLGLYHAGKK